jgi:hypothetical protein
VREFDRPIGRVWRRLRFQRFLGALVWCWGACLLVTAGAIALEKFAHRPLPGPDWVPFAVAGGVGLVLAALIAMLSGPSRVDAAVAIDRAFHLNERLATALTLPVDLRETPAGRALIADTIRHVDDLDIGSKFGLRLPRKAWVPLVPAALAVGLLFAPELIQRQARATSRAAELAEKAAVAKQAQALSRTIAKSRKEVNKAEFAETERLLAEIEKVAEEMAKAPPAEKGKAMVELNKLTDALKDRQRQLGSAEQINKQLQQLKEMSDSGPADEFAKEMARGDFQKAAEELKKIQEKMSKGELSESEKKALQQQLAEMKQQLEKLANMDERKKQLEEARKNGALTQQQYEQELNKLEQQAQNLDKLQKLAQQLGQAQQAMQQGDMNKAANTLGMSQEQLQELAKQVEELQTLDAALADLQDAKSGLSGEGMNQIGEALDGMGRMGMNRNNNGNGLGRGRGQGDRPEAPDDVSFHNTKTQQQYGKGKAVITGFAPPKGVTKGESVLDVQAELEATGEGIAEAMSNQRVPKAVEKHVLGYFDKIRKGD